MIDHDGAWKDVLICYFELFLAFFFPQAHADIDWSRGHEFLDKELQQIMPESELGRRTADLLVKVWLRDGNEVWVLIHVEIQYQEESGFPRRMYVYNYRIFDRYNRVVASFAVLGDDRPGWRPNRFEQSLWGCKVDFQFPVVKLLDFAADWQALEANPNPFATVVLTHLKAKETSKDNEAKRVWKLRLMRNMYERGFTREEIRNLFHFIDRILRLPKEMEITFWHDLQQIEEVKQMPYITSVERIGMEKGRLQGLLEAIEIHLSDKFGEAGLALMPEIRQIENLDVLRSIFKCIKTAPSPEELRKIWQSTE